MINTEIRGKIRPVDGEKLTNENADKILVQTGYTQRLWHVNDFLGGFEMGPFADIGYQTEFTKPHGAPRTRIWRGTAGAKLFDGKYLKGAQQSVSAVRSRGAPLLQVGTALLQGGSEQGKGQRT